MIITEHGDKIIVNEMEKLDISGLANKYRNLSMAKKFLDHQIAQNPKQIIDLNAELELINNQLSQNKKTIETYTNYFNQKGINPEEELNKLREKYSDEELQIKSETIVEKNEYELIETEEGIQRIKKSINTLEEVIILYLTNKYSEINLNQRILQIKQDLEKIKEREIVQNKNLENLNNNLNTIENYFKKKGIDINKELDKEAEERKKEEKIAQEIPLD